jgi:hypothetical protein
MKPVVVNNDSTPVGKFLIAKTVLNSIAYACQDREFSEEVDKLEAYGGERGIEVMSNDISLVERYKDELYKGN